MVDFELNSIDYTQDEILSFLQDSLPQPVYEESVPDGDTLKRNHLGQIDPYLAVQFGDVYARGVRSMIGQKGHDYSMSFAVQVVSPDANIGRKISNRVLSLILGKQFTYAPGGVEKLPVGGALMTINQSDPATQAYMVPSWYKIVIHYFDEDVV